MRPRHDAKTRPIGAISRKWRRCKKGYNASRLLDYEDIGPDRHGVMKGLPMVRGNPRSTARIAGHPIHPVLVPFPIACFVGTLLTDLTYWWTADMMWADLSAWLLAVGVILGWLAAIAGLVDFLGDRLIREQAPAWPHAIGNIVALILATLNMLVHTRDAWTSVVPWGLTLSALVVLILLFTGWLGWSMVYRHGVGVITHD
jgi:uncharacterized membrane protein